jgi:hypothetical protein
MRRKEKPRTREEPSEAEAMERMNEALKRALETPPRKHKDEPRRGRRRGTVKRLDK